MESKRCTQCLLPESLPSVILDRNGVCNHCLDYEKFYSRSLTPANMADRVAIFEDLVHHARKRNDTYDCLIPLSGGKDSTYALYVCSKLYNMRCLAITFDNGYLSNHARTNIHNAIAATDADHLFYAVNRNTMMKLYKTFLERCGSFCPACMRGIGMVIDSAKKYDIPLIVSGTGARVAYLAMIPELYQGGDINFFRNVLKGSNLENSTKQFTANDSLFNVKRLLGIVYRVLRISNTMKHKHIHLYDYFEPDFDHIYEVIKNEMGWMKPQGNVEHQDCLLHGIAGYIQTLKFPALTPATIYNSGQIRFGKMSKEEALKIENEFLQKPQVPPALDPFLKEINMEKDVFHNAVNDWNRMDFYRGKKIDFLRRIYNKIAGI